MAAQCARRRRTVTSIDALFNGLSERLPRERWTTAMAERVAYSYDNSRLHGLPDAVVFATCHEDVAVVLRLAHAHGIPVVARGRGTNTVGSTVPSAGGIALSLERMTRILDYQPDDRLLVCEPGTLNSSVQARAAADGLFWAPDPTSAAYSTVGGNLACGAGGPRAVKYGTARDAVLGLRAVDGTGRSLRAGCRTSKGVVGYDLTRLLVGSEGTLAVITEATLRLLPQPEQKRTMRAAYASVDAAVAAVARIMRQPATPCAVEFMDDEAVRLARTHSALDLPDRTRALLLLEVDGAESSIAHDVAAIEAAARSEERLDWQSATSAADSAALWSARKALSPALRHLAPKKVNEDVVVPISALGTLMRELRSLSERHGLPIVNFGHAGNGNIHVNILADPDDGAQMQAIDACLSDVFDLVLSLGGTLSGEHGVGIAKRDFVAREVDGETLDRMHALKAVFDPKGILNPGKALPGI